MEERSRSELLQRNEQVKAISSLMGNAGLTLAVGGFGRWFLEGLDEFVMFWLLCSAALIWTGVQVLIMLEAEDRAWTD